jgi:hypothetical protein
MAAPLIAAAGYFGLPRLLGALADQAMSSRYDSLQNRGVDPSSDALYNFLSLVPRRSGLEDTLQSIRDLYHYNTAPLSPSVPDFEQPSGYQVTREIPYEEGVVFNSPMEDFLKYGGRDDDSGNRFDAGASYGQTSMPAPEIRFDNPPGKSSMASSGFAGGGLADILRMMHAQRQR